jgi:Na+-transporting NADH:ubiquinone oxidoreductase subunit NqrF
VDGNIDPNDDLYSRWESIIAESDIREIPINFLKEVSIKLNDGAIVNFNVEDLLEKGLTLKEVEVKVHNFVEEFDDDIDTLDFHINIEALANEVDQKTRGLLGD